MQKDNITKCNLNNRENHRIIKMNVGKNGNHEGGLTMSVAKKMKKIAHDVFWGEGDTDHPICPECGFTMNFFGGDDVPIGNAVWK